MPDDPKLPPRPDALQKPQSVPAPIPRRTLAASHDPLNAPPPAPPVGQSQPEKEDTEEKKQRPTSSGLGEMDTPHVFAGVFASGIGRVIVTGLTCMIAFGLTEACYLFSVIPDGWRAGGIKGLFQAVLAIPAAPFASPSRFYQAISWNVGETLLGPPYLMLVIGGLILAVRSEIHIVKLCYFYFILGSIHSAAYHKMTGTFSLMMWVGMLIGSFWLYRWFWRQQEPEIEEAEEEEDGESEKEPGS